MSSDDRKAIEQTVQTYLDGLYEGVAEKLASVFHGTSALTYGPDATLVVLPRAVAWRCASGRSPKTGPPRDTWI